ncbi:MAG TPA: DUF721 domain-containing protein [Deltaproteobacteria bacterium]|nr:DUF721 domain-containing protein [Deltaproteobacteria bacterium]
MQKLGAILGYKYKPFARIIAIRKVWPEIAGELLASHTEPVLIKDKSLHVLCDSPAWVQQIGILAGVLLPRIREMAGVRVEKVEGKFGMLPVNKVQQKPAPKPFKMDIRLEDVQKMKNPELRSAIEALLKAQGGEHG